MVRNTVVTSATSKPLLRKIVDLRVLAARAVPLSTMLKALFSAAGMTMTVAMNLTMAVALTVALTMDLSVTVTVTVTAVVDMIMVVSLDMGWIVGRALHLHHL